MLRKNKLGFSLVELMIVAAGIAGVGLVAMNITKTSNKSSAKYQFDSDTAQITNEIVGILSTPAKCLTTLGGKNALSDSTVTSINGNQYYSSASITPPPSAGYGNAGLKISSYKLSALDAEVTANTSYLTIAFQNKKILSGQDTVAKKIKLYVEVNGSKLITKCQSVATASGDIWARGTGTTINYVGGNVGIGTSTPAIKLDVAGGIRAGDQTQVTLCNSSTEGTQRYNKTSHAMEYCGASGTPLVYAWTAVGSGGNSNGLPPNKTAICYGSNSYNTCEHSGAVYGKAVTDANGAVTLIQNEFGSSSVVKIFSKTVASCNNKSQTNTVMVDSSGVSMSYTNGNGGASFNCTGAWN